MCGSPAKSSWPATLGRMDAKMDEPRVQCAACQEWLIVLGHRLENGVVTVEAVDCECAGSNKERE